MDDINYYQALGLTEEQQEPDAGTDPGAAEETAAEETDSTETPEPDEAPEPEDEATPDDDDEGGEDDAAGGDSAVDASKRKQSKKENAKYAAARRKAEREEAIEQARREERERAKAEMDALIASANLENPYTGEKVKTREEWDAWQQRHRDEMRETVQRRSGLTDEQMQDFVSQLPEVQKAREAEAQAQQVLFRAQQEHAQAAIENELAKIREYDPNVNSLADIEKTAEHDEILDKVRRGYSLSDAWIVTHQQQIVRRQAAAARQAAVGAARSKDHLAATRSRGKGMEPVPADIREQYRLLNPGISDEEITRDYNHYLNTT